MPSLLTYVEIARINELRAMADMLQKQLEGSMHGPGSGSALGPRPSLSGDGGGGGRDNGGSVVLVSNLSEKVFMNYFISYVIVANIYWNMNYVHSCTLCVNKVSS